jgi:hypothetical protein
MTVMILAGAVTTGFGWWTKRVFHVVVGLVILTAGVVWWAA